MKRFVAKEDVEKGLVDPTKPLNQQPQYKKKLDEAAKAKQARQPKKQIQEKSGQIIDDKNQIKQVKQVKKHQKPQRNNRPQYNWNRKQILLQTPVPEAPKKILQKPDNEKFKAQKDKLVEQKNVLKDQIKKLIQEQKFLIKSNTDNKKGGFAALSKYAGQLKEKNNAKNIVDAQIKKLQATRKQIDAEIQSLKQKNQSLSHPKTPEESSAEFLKQRINDLQQRLSTANLDKKQQAQITNDINAHKRAQLKARPEIVIKTQISRNDDKIKILLDQSKTLKKEINVLYDQIRPIKKQIAILMEKKKEQGGVVKQVRSVQEIRAQYDVKIKNFNDKIQVIHKKLDQLHDKFNKEYDLYEDQQELIRYIKYVQEQQQYKRNRKQQQQKYQKQKQAREKQKAKQFQERKKKRQQHQRFLQEKKKKEQERRQQLQSERAKYLNRSPNWHKIEVCQFMISYCQNIKPENAKQQVEEKNVKQTDLNLTKQKGWEKEVKSGCEVIHSKKDKHDQEAPKKVKKQKKKKETAEDGSIHHTIDTVNRFHDLNILPPSNVSQLDQTIKQLQDKIDIYNKPSEQEVAAFKSRADAEFNQMHGLSETKHEYKERDNEHDEEKPKTEHKKKAEKVELKGTDFPQLN